jgi:hypothetical protein
MPLPLISNAMLRLANSGLIDTTLNFEFALPIRLLLNRGPRNQPSANFSDGDGPQDFVSKRPHRIETEIGDRILIR